MAFGRINFKDTNMARWFRRITGDVTFSFASGLAATLKTVNSNVGTWGSSTLIPSVTINAKGLVTAASNNSFASTGVLTLPLNSQSGDYTIVSSDQGKLVQQTSASNHTFTLDLAANLGTNWACYIQNSGTAVLTLTGTSSQQIDGLTSYAIYPGEIRVVRSDGISAFTSYVFAPFKWTITATGNTTFTRPPGYNLFAVQIWGGGGSGGCGASTSVSGGGGGGGSYLNVYFSAAQVGASLTVGVGAGGTAIAGTSTNGNVGNNTTFGTLLTAYGGGPGFHASSASAGGSGAGVFAVGVVGSANGATGGSPVGGIGTATTAPDSTMGGGASSGTTTQTNGGNSVYGGAGGGGGNTATTAGLNGGNSVYGGAGGGGCTGTGTRGTGGTSQVGGAGGQGGNSTNDGVAGSQPGGGGGGAMNGKNSGKGGDGQCIIYGIV